MQTIAGRPLRAGCLLVAASILVLASASALAARVGVLSNKYAPETAADFNAHIAGHTFTGIDTATAMPSLAQLNAQFDAVLLFEDGTFAQAPNVGSTVAAFAEGGHPVVLGTFYDQDRSDGPPDFNPHGWGDLEQIDPSTTDGVGTSYGARTLGTVVVHPLTVGVNSLSATKFAGGNAPKPGSVVVAWWTQRNARGDPDPAVAYRISSGACVIQVAIAPNYPVIGVLNTDYSGDFYPLWRNAFDFAAVRCISGAGGPGAVIAIPATSYPLLALVAALLMALGAWRLARRPVR